MVAERRCLTIETCFRFGSHGAAAGRGAARSAGAAEKMLEMMNRFASVVLPEKSEKKKTEQLDWRAMGETQQLKGGESEWVDWKFKFLNAVGSGSLTMRRGEHRERPGCDLRASDPETRGAARQERSSGGHEISSWLSKEIQGFRFNSEEFTTAHAGKDFSY